MTLDHFIRVRPLLRRCLALPAAMALAAVVSACSGDSPTAVFDPDAPARLALDARVRFQTTTGAALRVLASYQRSNQSLVRLDSQTIALTEAATQQVPITIDLGPCLRDAQRAGRDGATPASDECLVTLELALITGGEVVDRETLTNLSMGPGRTTTVNAPVTLEEVGQVRLLLPPANVVAENAPLRLEATRTMTIGAEVIDGAGRVITRPVVWSTDNAAVATVSATGVVTGVAPGTARIMAMAGILGQSIQVRVVPLPQQVTVTAGSGSTGVGIITSSPLGINCTINGTTTTGTCSASFPGDATVSLTQNVLSMAAFVGWGGDCSGTTCVVTSSQPRTVTATFQAIRQLVVTGSGTGNGTITGTPGPINCVWRNGSGSGQCLAQYPEGTSITLTATAESGSQFFAWTGDCGTVTGNSCTITMNANRSVNAEFRAISVHRITAGIGTGTGVVTSSPAGMNCVVNGTAISGTCSLTVTAGTPVALIATGTNGATFRTWEGACAFGGNPCNFSGLVTPGTFEHQVAFDRLANLTITPDPRSTGTGQLNGTNLFFCRTSGTTVTTAPCTGTYVVGTTVQIDAFATGFTDFVRWGGACATSTSNRCTLVITADVAATIQFEEVPTATLRLELEGEPSGLRLNQAPYLGNRDCVRSGSSNDPPTACNFTVAVNRQLSITKLLGPQYFGFFLNGSLCYDAPDPCFTSIASNATATMFTYDVNNALRRGRLGADAAAAPGLRGRRR